jgi:succinyl-diaminopimelate desuccinylase
MDMKASIACFISVFKEVANKVNYPLGLQLVTDEETGGFNGTKYQIEKGVRSDFTIVGETTNYYIENQAKGIVWVKIFSKGKAAHGAYPWKGKNAIWEMQHFLINLEKKFPLPSRKQWVTTVNLAKINTANETFNKIPDNCEVWLDIRYIPQDKDTIIKTVKNLLPKGFKLEILVKEPAQFVNENNYYIEQLQKIGKSVIKKKVELNQGQGSSDARHFTRVNCDAIEFGPLGAGMGTDNEWVDIKSLEKYSLILKNFLLSIQTNK